MICVFQTSNHLFGRVWALGAMKCEMCTYEMGRIGSASNTSNHKTVSSLSSYLPRCVSILEQDGIFASRCLSCSNRLHRRKATWSGGSMTAERREVSGAWISVMATAPTPEPSSPSARLRLRRHERANVLWFPVKSDFYGAAFFTLNREWWHIDLLTLLPTVPWKTRMGKVEFAICILHASRHSWGCVATKQNRRDKKNATRRPCACGGFRHGRFNRSCVWRYSKS